MRLSRHCYDKPHRCPGWAGGGFRYARVNRCEGGRIQIDYSSRWKRNWTFHRCDRCNVVCWPIVIRELDWRWWLEWRLWRFWTFWLPERFVWPVQRAIVIVTRSYRLDQRWKTRIWEPVPEGEQNDDTQLS